VVIKNLPLGLCSSWPPNHPHTDWLHHCLLSTNKLLCGGRSGAIWLPSHHLGGGCTLVVVEEIPPSMFPCKMLWVPKKALYKCNELLLLLFYYSMLFCGSLFCFVLSTQSIQTLWLTLRECVSTVISLSSTNYPIIIWWALSGHPASNFVFKRRLMAVQTQP